MLSILQKEPILWPLLLLLAAIYLLPGTRLPEVVEQRVIQHYQKLPDVKVDFHPSRTFRNRFSTNRTALYIETRDQVKHVTPLLLHMTQVVPPEWRFVFLGTQSIVKKVNQSSAVQRMVKTGKLRLGYTERWTNKWDGVVDIHETHHRLLTNLSFYDEQFPNVEWLLNFRSTAILCASANRTVNDYLQYDWVGAPWSASDSFGGNGGLSLRRLSKVRAVLKFQSRPDTVESEDRWLSKRIGLMPGANNANATVEKDFSVEDVWSDQPMGYHINPNLAPGTSRDVWDTLEKRKKIYNYCPEIKMIMNMRLERERCPELINYIHPVDSSEYIYADVGVDSPEDTAVIEEQEKMQEELEERLRVATQIADEARLNRTNAEKAEDEEWQHADERWANAQAYGMKKAESFNYTKNDEKRTVADEQVYN